MSEQRSGVPTVAAIVLIVVAVALLVWVVLRARSGSQSQRNVLPDQPPPGFGQGIPGPEGSTGGLIVPGAAGDTGGVGGADVGTVEGE